MRTHFYLKGIKLPVTKCKRPTFRSHRGRTWDHGYIHIDGIKYEAHLDTTWGKRIYFQYGTELLWHSVQMWSEPEAQFVGKEFDIDPFSETLITTTK